MTAHRSPRFGPRAAELGAGSLISFHLDVQEDRLGALNLCGATGARFGGEKRFGDEKRAIGEVLAAHAALALSGPVSTAG